jgi:hypothetical protein
MLKSDRGLFQVYCIPTPPTACLEKANSTALSASNTTNLPDTLSISNSNVVGNVNATTTTCAESPLAIFKPLCPA